MGQGVRWGARRGITFAVGVALAASPAAAQYGAVGINSALRNKVEIRSASTNKVKPAVIRQAVILNDEVRTAEASWLQILLLDKTIFTVGANARVAVDKFVWDPTANTRATQVSVTRGAFRFMSGRTLGHPTGPASVRTPVAVIGVRGTIFEGVVGEEAIAIARDQPAVGKVKSNEDEASLIVLRGPGAQAQGDVTPGIIDVTAAGRTVTLDRPGLAAYVPRAGAPPIGPFQINMEGLQALQTLLRPESGGGGGGRNGGGGGSNVAKTLLGIGVGVAAGGLLGGGRKGSDDSYDGRGSVSPNQAPSSSVQSAPKSPAGK